MVPVMSSRSPWFAPFDAFRTVPKDLAEGTMTGAAMTVAAFATCSILFFCEASAFLSAKPTTRIVIDSNQDSVLRINFDVHMLDLACEFLTVGVWDAFGTERMNVSRNIVKQRVDHKGVVGRRYTDDEIIELEFGDTSFTKEELSELDSDWGSSSDHFKHDSFQDVIDAHDFTMVNFYADWCPHCRQFGPIWGNFEYRVNEHQDEAKDADGAVTNVRVLKINCVDFEDTCREQKVHSFPDVRLYHRGSNTEKQFASYRGSRTPDALITFMKTTVAEHHLHAGVQYHEMFSEGCRISGYLEAARVPGTVHFQASHTGDKTLNLAFTNVSHHVHHFSFGEAPRRSIHALPSEYKRHVNPLDGKTFAVDKFHKAPNHFIKVVHTRFVDAGIRSYQQTHQHSVRTIQRNAIPQSKFSYDLSPVEVIVTAGERRWYDFVTQVFAIIGGAFSVMSMATGVLKFTSAQLKSTLGKLG